MIIIFQIYNCDYLLFSLNIVVLYTIHVKGNISQMGDYMKSSIWLVDYFDWHTFFVKFIYLRCLKIFYFLLIYVCIFCFPHFCGHLTVVIKTFVEREKKQSLVETVTKLLKEHLFCNVYKKLLHLLKLFQSLSAPMELYL